MMNRRLSAIAGGVCIFALAACGTPNAPMYPQTSTYPTATQSAGAVNVVPGFGVVQSIDMIPREQAAIGVGTIAGAVVGGVLGNQIGSGTGRTAATVAGVAGGAMAGRALERGGQQDQVYRITLRMDDGTVQSLVQEASPSLRPGDRIRINNGVIERL